MSVTEVNDANYIREVQNSPLPVLLDFYATWCGPCQMLAPVIEELDSQREDLVVGKVDVDEEPGLAMRFQVASIPTVMVFRGGKLAGKVVGYVSREELCRGLGI